MSIKDESYVPMLPTGSYPVRGVACYAVKIGKRPTEKGRRQRYKCHTEKTREAAEEFIVGWNKDIREKDPVSLNELTRKQKAEIIYSLERLEEAGVSLRHVVDTYFTKTNPISLKMSLSVAYEKFEAIQRFENVAQRNIVQARKIYKRFIKICKNKPIGLVTKGDVREFLNSGNCNDTSKQSYLKNLNVFFTKLKREGLNADNPCEAIKINTVTKISKGYEAWELYVFLCECIEQKQWKTMTAFVFTAFFGLRLNESTGLLWEDMPDIDNVDGTINVEVEVAKTKKRRTLYISGAGKSWLRLIPQELRKGKLAIRQSIQWHPCQIRKICKSKYPNFTLGINQARQAFAANHFAKYGDIQKLRMTMGNSPAVIETNYNGLVKNKEEEIYWRLFAPNVLVTSLDKTITSKIWKRFKGQRINEEDYMVLSLNEELMHRSKGTNTNEGKDELIAIKNEKVDEFNWRCKSESLTEDQKNKYLLKVLRAAKRKAGKENKILAESILFERQYQIKPYCIESIKEVIRVKDYLEKMIGQELKLPSVMEDEIMPVRETEEIKVIGLGGSIVKQYSYTERWVVRKDYFKHMEIQNEVVTNLVKQGIKDPSSLEEKMGGRKLRDYLKDFSDFKI